MQRILLTRKAATRKVKRKALRKRDLTVILHGFGENTRKEAKLATLVYMGPMMCEVELKDEEGKYRERYSLVTGTRLCDVGGNDGWRISLRDAFIPTTPPRPQPPKGSRVRKLYEETHSLNERETLIIEVYEESSIGERYLKVTRRKETLTEGDAVPKARDYPGLITLGKVDGFIRNWKESNDDE